MDFITYLRVSTKDQGQSGLGIEDQRQKVQSHLKEGDRIISEFVEFESGRNNDRPKIKEALQLCAQTKSTLLIARLDRLARSVSFISKLIDSKVCFLALDIPGANEFTIHVIAAMAEQEAKRISQNTRAALGVLKRSGKQLGHVSNLSDKGRVEGAMRNREISIQNENNIRAFHFANLLMESNPKITLDIIAQKLNAGQFKTSAGYQYSKSSVSRMIKRFTEHQQSAS